MNTRKADDYSNNTFQTANVSNPNNDIIVRDCPSEAISCLRFCPAANIFAVTSWNNAITCYKYDENLSTKIVATNNHQKAVLCCNWNSTGEYLFTGGCDNNVNKWFINGKYETLGHHKASVQCVEYSKTHNILVSASWDKTVKYWDIRNKKPLCCSVNVGAKVYAMSIRGNSMVTGLSNQCIQHYDLRKCTKYVSSEHLTATYKAAYGVTKSVKAKELNYGIIRDIEIFPDKRGYVAVLMQGRAMVRYFDKKVGEEKWGYHYKCHRDNKWHDSRNLHKIYSVNVVRFHPKYHTFVTGGDDGQIKVMDKDARMIVKTFQSIQESTSTWFREYEEPIPITTIDFDRNGIVMGYASSYNWNEGIKGYDKDRKKPQIYLHDIRSIEFSSR